VFERAARDRESSDGGSRHGAGFAVMVVDVPPPADNCVVQRDFWRELAAWALYWAAGWV
jgi:hypothetical protein